MYLYPLAIVFGLGVEEQVVHHPHTGHFFAEDLVPKGVAVAGVEHAALDGADVGSLRGDERCEQNETDECGLGNTSGTGGVLAGVA